MSKLNEGVLSNVLEIEKKYFPRKYLTSVDFLDIRNE